MNPTSAMVIESGTEGAIQSNRKPVWLAYVPKFKKLLVGQPPVIIAASRK